jgi:hypothetical protein
MLPVYLIPWRMGGVTLLRRVISEPGHPLRYVLFVAEIVAVWAGFYTTGQRVEARRRS